MLPGAARQRRISRIFQDSKALEPIISAFCAPPPQGARIWWIFLCFPLGNWSGKRSAKVSGPVRCEKYLGDFMIQVVQVWVRGGGGGTQEIQGHFSSCSFFLLLNDLFSRAFSPKTTWVTLSKFPPGGGKI